MKEKWSVIPWYKIDWEKGQRSQEPCVTDEKKFKTFFFAKRYAYEQAKENSECVVIESTKHPCNYYVTWGNHHGIWSPKTGDCSPLIIRK